MRPNYNAALEEEASSRIAGRIAATILATSVHQNSSQPRTDIATSKTVLIRMKSSRVRELESPFESSPTSARAMFVMFV